MKHTSKQTLQRELRSSGASAAEAADLLHLAGQLRSLPADPNLAAGKPARSALKLRWLPKVALAATALLAGMSLVTFSQTSLPGSALYPVKRLSEKAAVAVQPNYRATLMMRRAQEVNQLVAKGASTHVVQRTLAEYQVEAAAYKATNYPAFEYCKSNLQRAETHATPSEKQMIAAVLKNLGDIK